MRRKVKNRNMVKPDLKFNSEKVEKFINCVMERGKKNTARSAVYDAFEVIKEKAKVENPISAPAALAEVPMATAEVALAREVLPRAVDPLPEAFA